MTEHGNNWAVLVCTSTFWSNYRHIANALTIYHIVRRLGIPDDHIILMLGEDIACNPRNTFPATVFNNIDRALNVYDADVEVDYRGADVTVNNFIRLLTNRLPSETPRSKKLMSDEQSNVLIYMTGHGGDNFLKFQGMEEINSLDLADALNQMHEGRRYNQILFVLDTCQAGTLFDHVTAPNVTVMASSIKGESSYSYHADELIGVSVLDRFTWCLLSFFREMQMDSRETVQDLFISIDKGFLSSTPFMNQTPGTTPAFKLNVLDFFGNVRALDRSPHIFKSPPEPGIRETIPLPLIDISPEIVITRLEHRSFRISPGHQQTGEWRSLALGCGFLLALFSLVTYSLLLRTAKSHKVKTQ